MEIENESHSIYYFQNISESLFGEISHLHLFCRDVSLPFKKLIKNICVDQTRQDTTKIGSFAFWDILGIQGLHPSQRAVPLRT